MSLDLAIAFGKKIREARKDRGMTQVQLARAANVSRSSVLRIEAGANVGIEELHKIAHALGFVLSLSETVLPTWETAAEFFLKDDD